MIDIVIAVVAIAIVIWAIVKQIRLYKSRKFANFCAGDCAACERNCDNTARKKKNLSQCCQNGHWLYDFKPQSIFCLC